MFYNDFHRHQNTDTAAADGGPRDTQVRVANPEMTNTESPNSVIKPLTLLDIHLLTHSDYVLCGWSLQFSSHTHFHNPRLATFGKP
jgi:hypothetical protein